MLLWDVMWWEKWEEERNASLPNKGAIYYAITCQTTASGGEHFLIKRM